MKKSILAILMLFLASCTSITVTQPANVGSSPTGQAGLPGSLALQVTPPGGPAQANSIPVNWRALSLNGQLIMILPTANGTNIAKLDLVSGAIKTLFQAPQQALLNTALASPDGKQILLVYAPPVSSANQQTYTSLYLMPADGSGAPKPIFPSPSSTDAFFAPAWAPDGNSIYTSHFIQGTGDENSPNQFAIERVTLDGKMSRVLGNAEWPRISPDGTKLSFVSATPDTTNNELYMANIDGSQPIPVLQPAAYPAVDDHFFTPDGKSIIFSAVNNYQAVPTPTVLDRLFGIQIASAHTIPSDWYRVSISGGQVDRLTNLNDTGMYATVSPDKNWMAFISQTGLYVIRIDGTGLTQLSDLVATGTVDWVP
jgi:Tol biopolymer transport system component